MLYVEKLANSRIQFSIKVPDNWSAVTRKCIDYNSSKGINYMSSEESDTDSDGRRTLQTALQWLRKK